MWCRSPARSPAWRAAASLARGWDRTVGTPQRAGRSAVGGSACQWAAPDGRPPPRQRHRRRESSAPDPAPWTTHPRHGPRPACAGASPDRNPRRDTPDVDARHSTGDLIAPSENLSYFHGSMEAAHVRFRRTALAAVLTVATAALSTAVAPPAPASAALPTAAVALGDSFISGEGAGAYPPVVDVNGVSPGLPRLVRAEQQRLLLPPLRQRLAVPGQPAGHPGPVQPGLLRRPARTTSPTPPVARTKGRYGRLAARPAPRRRADPRHRPGAGRPRLQQQLVHLRQRRREVRQPVHRRRLDRLVGVLGVPRAGRWSRSRAPTPTWPPPRRSAPRPRRPPPPYARS